MKTLTLSSSIYFLNWEQDWFGISNGNQGRSIMREQQFLNSKSEPSVTFVLYLPQEVFTLFVFKNTYPPRRAGNTLRVVSRLPLEVFT